MAALILIFCLLSLVIAAACHLLTHDFKLQNLPKAQQTILNSMRIAGAFVVIAFALRALTFMASLPQPIPQILVATVAPSLCLFIYIPKYLRKAMTLTAEEAAAIEDEMRNQESP